MALKKPSEYFKPKEKLSVDSSIQELEKTPELNTFSDAFESFKNNLNKIEALSEFSDTLDNYRINIEKVNCLSEKVNDIQSEILNLLKKEDLDRAMMAQLIIVEQTIRDVQFKVKSINEKSLTEIRLDVSELTNSVNEFLEIEVPKYKKLVVDSELRTNHRYEELETNINQTLESIEEFVEDKYQELTESLQGIDEQSLSGIIEDFRLLDKNVIELKEKEIPKYKGFIVETERKTESKLNEFDEKLDKTISNLLEKIELVDEDKTHLVTSVSEKIEEVSNLKEFVIVDIEKNETLRSEIKKKINDLEVEIIRNESHVKNQTKQIENIHEEVREVISKLQIEELEEKNYELSKKVKYLEEVFEKFNEKEILTENIIVEPPSTKNKDPLTPLDKNFVTLDQLQQHYRLFINRIQQQLATIGGGGETRLKYLDDIVGIATNASAYDGKFLKYDHSAGNFIFETVSGGGGGGGGESYWTSTSAGIHTLSNVGIGTTAKSDFKLFVEGNAKITGILTVGNQSVTIDGSTNTIKVGSGVTINGNTGIISATAIYVAGSQVSTFSGNYNDLSNKPDLSTISVAYATTAGIATALQNPRTFEITGDIVASPISFDGTGNVSLAATIQPNSVALGGDTTGDYVQSITGTSNQITVTSGTGESSTPTLSIPSQFTAPQDVTVTRDLQVNRNLNVNGNITIGGTSATLFTTEFKVYDPDIVLGFRTDAFGNDISTDNTANHGGIAIASTEGTPLISLYDVGIGETNPSTYKKFMWFKSGTFSGLGTDAWISNYAIGIGSTQVPNGVRLAAGGMQVTDRTLSVPQLNISGVSTLGITTFTGAISFGTSAFFGTDDRLILGDSSNLQLYYNSVNSIVSASAGLIVSGSSITYSSDAHSIQNAANTRTFANFAPSGTTFYYNNNTRLQINTSGITVTGTTFTDQLSVSGVTTSTGGFVGNLTGTATTATVAQGLTGTPNITVGILTATSGNFSGIITSSGAVVSGATTATSFSGSGTNLTGIVTSIVAGTNVTISGSTGQVTINASGGGTSLGIATAGGTVGTGVTLIDFRGPGISAVTVSSGIGTINITGGGGSSTPDISPVMMGMIF